MLFIWEYPYILTIVSLLLLLSSPQNKQNSAYTMPIIFREEISRKYLMVQLENVLTIQPFLVLQFTTGG